MYKFVFNIGSKFFSVQFSSVTQQCLTLCDPMDWSRPGFPRLLPTPKICSNSCASSQWCHSTISSCHPLLFLPSPSPPAFNLSQHQSVFQSVSSSHQQPKYWRFNFSLSAFNEYSGLIFTMNWLDLLAGQGTLKSLLQHHNSKASILRRSAFFIVQLSHPYMTTGKTIALTRRTFVGKIMSLLLNMLSRLVITYLSRS